MATVFETSNLTARARAIDARIHKMQDEGQLQRLHCAVIKDIGPSCVNRDMSGEQKTITYGGVRRMFVSSQSIWQRPRQDELNDVFRTRRIALYMNSRLRKDLPGHSDEWYNYAASTASPSKDSSKDAEDKKEPLATYSEADIEEMVAIINENFHPSSEKKEDLEDLARRVEIREEDLAAKREELEAIIGSTAEQEAKLQERRDACAKVIDERTMSAYERIRKSVHNHLAVVPVYNEDSCGGCFNTITPQRLIDIESNKKLVICEHCGRIIVNPKFE